MAAHGLEQRAARLATRMRVPLPESASSDSSLSRLTPREREILDHLATGATNKAIAQDLFISEKTVSVHLSNILAKLGVENRGAAAALARNVAHPSHEKNQRCRFVRLNLEARRRHVSYVQTCGGMGRCRCRGVMTRSTAP
jgi:DNA-binding CsgD family transcriptional regulator